MGHSLNEVHELKELTKSSSLQRLAAVARLCPLPYMPVYSCSHVTRHHSTHIIPNILPITHHPLVIAIMRPILLIMCSFLMRPWPSSSHAPIRHVLGLHIYNLEIRVTWRLFSHRCLCSSVASPSLFSTMIKSKVLEKLQQKIQLPPQGPFSYRQLTWTIVLRSRGSNQRDAERAYIPWDQVEDFISSDSVRKNAPCQFSRSIMQGSRLVARCPDPSLVPC